MPFFTVVIASRNRPELAAAAVQCVLQQDFDDFELLVVDDGSEPEYTIEQMAASHRRSDQVRMIRLESQFRGRGAAYARNVGVWQSSGAYCAFLDDDDLWLKNDHLSCAFHAISNSSRKVDLYFSNQEACFPATGETRELWLFPLAEKLPGQGRTARNGCYRVSADDLMGIQGFCHLNTTIVNREFFNEISGLDEYLAYEEDLDFYLRAVDLADTILYSPALVARHNVPDKTRQSNASTALGSVQRLNVRSHLLNKNLVTARHASVARFCTEYYASTVKTLCETYVDSGDYAAGSRQAARALAAGFSMKWLAYTLYLRMRSALARGKSLGG